MCNSSISGILPVLCLEIIGSAFPELLQHGAIVDVGQEGPKVEVEAPSPDLQLEFQARQMVSSQRNAMKRKRQQQGLA